MNQSILVVDDDPVVRELISEYLRGRGFNVTVLENGMVLQRKLQEGRPALIVPDIMMPELDGISALRALRVAGDDIPVILLTARADPIDRVIGLELGADDYLGKPLEPNEPGCTHSHRTAPSRRHRAERAGATRALSFRPFRSEFPGARITLRSSEFAMLKVFVTHAMTVLTRAQLFEKLHGNSEAHRNRSLDVSIWHLQRLIEVDLSEPRYVQTVWGCGYVFVLDGEIGAAEHSAPVLS